MADEKPDYLPNLNKDLHTKEDLIAEQRDHPRRDHLLQWMEVSVSEPEKRTGGPSMKMQDAYMVYLVETKVIDEEMPGFEKPPTSLWRRYSEFELLKQYLEVLYSSVVIPPLPEKRVSHAWSKLATDRFEAEFVERRRVGLENFLLRVASHSQLSQDKMFHAFLKQDDGWREAICATEFYSKADSKIKAISASYRLKKPDRNFEEIKNYSSELQTHINNILKIRARICDHCYGVHKIHQNYSRVFKEWSGIEKEMSSGLDNASNYIDVYSRSIDAHLEDEEQFAEQLKEYYTFGDSLRNVCRKQELLHLDVEKAEDNLSYKSSQREQVQQGKVNALSLSGIKTKLFGNDTPEQKEQKLKQLDQDIIEAEEKVRVTTEELEKFVQLALKDIDRFKRQKVKDLKDVFTNYAIMQIDQCKKGITLWQNTKDSFAKM